MDYTYVGYVPVGHYCVIAVLPVRRGGGLESRSTMFIGVEVVFIGVEVVFDHRGRVSFYRRRGSFYMERGSFHWGRGSI